MSEMIPSPALNPEADNQRNFARERVTLLEERCDRLALSNRMLRDRIRELVELLRGFGVYQSP